VTVLVDSDILIELFRGRNQEISARWGALGDTVNRVLYSPVTAAELWAGARPKEHVRLTVLFESLECADLDGISGRKAGDYLREFGKSHGMDIADSLIAATAWSYGAAVWTRNHKHYPMKDIAFF
jgi:predicted nucleic acid-binding protein